MMDANHFRVLSTKGSEVLTYFDIDNFFTHEVFGGDGQDGLVKLLVVAQLCV
jgi:hypothetical protein